VLLRYIESRIVERNSIHHIKRLVIVAQGRVATDGNGRRATGYPASALDIDPCYLAGQGADRIRFTFLGQVFRTYGTDGITQRIGVPFNARSGNDHFSQLDFSGHSYRQGGIIAYGHFHPIITYISDDQYLLARLQIKLKYPIKVCYSSFRCSFDQHTGAGNGKVIFTQYRSGNASLLPVGWMLIHGNTNQQQEAKQ